MFKRCWKGSVNLLLIYAVLKIERKMSFVPTLPFGAKSPRVGMGTGAGEAGNLVTMIRGHVLVKI